MKRIGDKIDNQVHDQISGHISECMRYHTNYRSSERIIFLVWNPVQEQVKDYVWDQVQEKFYEEN